MEYLPHEAVVVVRLNLAGVDNLAGERSVASRSWDELVTAAAEHAIMDRSAKRLFPQFQTYCAVVTRRGYNYNSTSIRLRFDRRSTPIRLQFDRATTIRRPTLRP